MHSLARALGAGHEELIAAPPHGFGRANLPATLKARRETSAQRVSGEVVDTNIVSAN